jgi:CheY-like chemotaxis protein
VALIARVRSLARLKLMTDELRMRAVTSRHIGIRGPEREALKERGRDGRILIVEDRQLAQEAMSAMLAVEHSVDVEADPNAALFRAAEGNYDLLIVSLGLANFDGLRLCSQVRSLERTRNVPLLAVANADDNMRLARGLEIGVNDFLFRPLDKNELLARVRTQVRKKRYTERLRDNVQMSIELAITDALTTHNRRYMETHISGLIEQAFSREAAHRACPRYRLFQIGQRHGIGTMPATRPRSLRCASGNRSDDLAAMAARSSVIMLGDRPGGGGNNGSRAAADRRHLRSSKAPVASRSPIRSARRARRSDDAAAS